MSVKVKFWGVRGSVPAPLTSADVEKKVLDALCRYGVSQESPFRHRMPNEIVAAMRQEQPLTYGGNTSCVEVRDDKNIFVLDMGTGLRPFGNSLFPELMKQRGIEVCFITSHVHWDHIQGFPFFGPLYLSKTKGFKNAWHFLGGTEWQKTAEACLRGQMDPPTFPVSWKKISRQTHRMTFQSMTDGLSLSTKDGGPILTFGELNHPQETYGVRFEFPGGPIVVYTTDNEPHDPLHPTPTLLALAKDADIWITDCQYTQHQYHGIEGGVTRYNWGHSYPEAVAATALQANAKHVILFHHDPASSDEQISNMRVHTEQLIREGGGQQKVSAAWEGLELTI